MGCLFLYADKSRTAVVSSSGTLGELGVDRLADPQPYHRMRLDGASANFTMDLGEVLQLDVLSLVSTTLFAGSDIRVWVSDSDPTATGSLTYDSGTLAGVTDEKWLGQVVMIAPAAIAGRYVRWDLTVPSGNAIDVGLAPVGLSWRPTYNRSYGAQFGYQDYGTRDGNPRTGGVFGVEGPKSRLHNISFSSLDPDEIDGYVTEMDILVGVHGDILFVPTVDATAIKRAQKSVWGGFSAVGQPRVSTATNFRQHVRAYQIVERL